MSAQLARVPLRLIDGTEAIPVASRQPADSTAPVNGAAPKFRFPKFHHHVGQRKYNVDMDSPVLDKLTFWGVFLPLFRFFHKHFGFIAPDEWSKKTDAIVESVSRKLGHLPADVEKAIRDAIQETPLVYSAREHQGCYFSKEDAQKDAARYPFGYVVDDVPLNGSWPEQTLRTRVYFPRTSQRTLSGLLSEAKETLEIVQQARAYK